MKPNRKAQSLAVWLSFCLNENYQALNCFAPTAIKTPFYTPEKHRVDRLIRHFPLMLYENTPQGTKPYGVFVILPERKLSSFKLLRTRNLLKIKI